MFTTSADFKTGMAEPSRQLTARGLITYPDSATQALTSAEISKIQITENAGEHLPLGGVSASTLTLSLDNRSGEWNAGGSILGSHSLDGATVKLEVGVYYNSAYQYSNLGIFVLEDVVGQEQETLITLKGADYLANAAGITWADGLTYPKTVIQILTEACSQSGITLKSTTFTNSTQSIATKPVWDENTTCRDVIGYIACLGCGFARINRDGELEIIGFERNAAGDIDDLLNSYFTYTDGVLTFNSDDTILTLGTDGADLTADPDGLVTGVGNDLVVTAFWDGDRYYVYPSRYKTLTRQGAIFGPFNALSVYEFGAPNGYGATRIADDINIVDNELNSVAVQGNPLLAYELCDTLMANMLTALSGLTFYGGSIAWQGDPTITCGDFVDVYSLNNEAIPLLVLNQTITLDAGFSMSSGNNLNSKVKGKAKTEYMRVFTPTGRLNAAALDGDINIRAGRQLNLLAGADIKVKSGANVDIEAGGKINLSAPDDIVVSSGKTLTQYAAEEITLAVGGIQVGGTNLRPESLAVTSNNTGIMTISESTISTYIYKGTKSYRLIVTGAGTKYARLSNNMSFVAGRTYTASYYVRSGTSVTNALYYDNNGAPTSTTWSIELVEGVFYRVTHAFTPSVTGVPTHGVLMYINSDLAASTSIAISGIKIEEGNKATDWSPSPSDPASGVKTSYIDIATDHIDIASGGLLNLSATNQIVFTGGSTLADMLGASGNVTYTGATAPASPNTGDLWFDTGNYNVCKRWNGSAWTEYTQGKLSNSKMTLDATGISLLSGGTFTVASTNFMIDSSGNVSMKGAITADTGYIGGTSGFTIQSAKLYSGKSTLTSTTAGVYVGTDGISLGAAGTPTFKVTAAGALNSTSGVIGGFTIGATTLSSTDVTFDSSNNKLTLKNLSLQNDTVIPGWGSIRMSEGHGFAVSADEFYVYIDDDTSTDSRGLCLALDYDEFSVLPDAYFAADVSALTFTDRP